MAGYRYIRASSIREDVKKAGKRCGSEFLDELNTKPVFGKQK